jgi:hypothetical protein
VLVSSGSASKQAPVGEKKDGDQSVGQSNAPVLLLNSGGDKSADRKMKEVVASLAGVLGGPDPAPQKISEMVSSPAKPGKLMADAQKSFMRNVGKENETSLSADEDRVQGLLGHNLFLSEGDENTISGEIQGSQSEGQQSNQHQ